MSHPIGILCVDDNTALAESVRLLVRSESDLHWIGHLASAERLAEAVRRSMPSILLLDLSMPGPHPLEVLRQLQSEGLEMRAIIVSGLIDAEHVAEAMDAGAWGYVSKHESPDAIVAAIRQVVRGEVAFPKVTAAR